MFTIFKDTLYEYLYADYCNAVFVELILNEEERSKMKKIDYAPVVDHAALRQKAKENGVNIPKNFIISLQELYSGCYNLEDASVYNSFNFDDVKFFTYMFSGCRSLKDITFVTKLKDRIYKMECSAKGMFADCYESIIPRWVTSDAEAADLLLEE